MTMRRPPGTAVRRVDLVASGWRAEEVAVLRHPSLPWGERPGRAFEVDAEPLARSIAWGERDRLSVLGQLAAHLAFVRAAGLPWGRFDAGEWRVTRKRSDDARLVRVTFGERRDESASSFLSRAAELLRAPRLSSLEASWVKPDSVYAEIDARLRTGPRTRRWLREAALGSALSPGLAAAQQLADGIPMRLGGDDEAIAEAVATLAALLPSGRQLFEIGGSGATPLRPFSAIASLGDVSQLEPGAEAAALERIDPAIERGAILLLLRGERFDTSSAHLLRLLASDRRDLSWIVAGEIPALLERAIEPERAPLTALIVVSPFLTARRELESLLESIPAPERAGWLRGFVQSDRFDLLLDEGLLPSSPAIESTEEPRRSYLAALAIAGPQVPAGAAAAILRELGWLRPIEDLAAPGLVRIDHEGVEFASAGIRRAFAGSLPEEARPGLCALAAAALTPFDPWRADLLRLECGDAGAASALACSLDESRRREIAATIARMPSALRARGDVVALHARALFEEGRYRLAREEAERLPRDERALMIARIERRLGRYGAAERALEPLVTKKRCGAPPLLAAAELARLRGQTAEAGSCLARAEAEATVEEKPAIAYERAVLAVDCELAPDPSDVACAGQEPYLAARLATYLALGREDYAVARTEAEQAMARARNPLERIDASLDLFFALFLEGEWDLARMRGRECLALVEETDGDRAAGGVLFTLGFLFADRGEWERAEDALSRLRAFYAHASDLRRLRETSLVAAHLAFVRGRYPEARAHVAELDLAQLSADEREAAFLILDEIDSIEGAPGPLRSSGTSSCRELRDRHLLLRAARESRGGDGIQNPFLRSVAEWLAAARSGEPVEPPEARSSADALLLVRRARAGRKVGLHLAGSSEELARSLGVEPEPVATSQGHPAAATELEILQRVASLPYPFLPSDLAGRAWLFARRNRLGVWNQVGSLDPSPAEALDALLDAPAGDWLRCADDALLHLEGVAAWSEGSRRSVASLFLIRSEHWALKRAIDQASTIAEAKEEERGGILGAAAPMRELFLTLGRVARREVTICIEGESGSGKELIARAIHDASPRRAKPFV
ncbi:MAG TPA: sigma 54-interacting transcriptional regulator, partial [Thermoanaerobaculia bacterium]|nr:sigma 54-interacting transcriptional regulator [Thermoanaerobaculia bacterium]